MNETTEPTALECGCEFTPGTPVVVEPGWHDMDELAARITPGKFKPCGQLHSDLAKRMRRPGSNWVVLPLATTRPL